jgi:predicted lipoprotein with Yx(FWY)xxD motif
MKKLNFIALAGAVLFVTHTNSFAQGTMMPDGIKMSGGMLTDAKGMTLYTYDNDKKPGKSACTGQCSTNWPAVTMATGSMVMGPWTTIARDDGSKQLAYKGKPLYTFAHDAKPGDMNGDGRGKVWHMAMP